MIKIIDQFDKFELNLLIKNLLRLDLVQKEDLIFFTTKIK